jgi:alanine dehydrogenase
MTLHINESEVRQFFDMKLAIEAVESVSRKQAAGIVIVHPRRRFELPNGGYFHYMAAMDTEAGFIAMKQYTYVKGALRFLVPLYEISTGALLALIEADYMGQLRTGAASGVATKYLARQNAKVAAIIGTGGQAKTQLEAITAVCKLDFARAYGRDPERRATSGKPVLSGVDLPAGVHINAIGANHAHKRELDDEAFGKVDLIFVDSLEQSKQEAGDLIIPFAHQSEKWSQVHELADLVGRKVAGRTSDAQTTLFKSNGIAAWDLAAAMVVYKAVRDHQQGTEIPFFTA